MVQGLLKLLIIIIGIYLAHFIPNYVAYKKLIKIFNTVLNLNVNAAVNLWLLGRAFW